MIWGLRTLEAHVREVEARELGEHGNVDRDRAADAAVVREVELLERGRERGEELQRLVQRRACVRAIVGSQTWSRMWWDISTDRRGRSAASKVSSDL